MDSCRLFGRLQAILRCIDRRKPSLTFRPSIAQLNCRFFADEAPTAATTRVKPLYIKKYHEPEYLERLKPSVPFYDLYNINVKGFDFAVIEQFATLIQRLCKDAGVKLEAFWPVPATVLKYETYADESSYLESSEEVKIHSRTIQLKHLTTNQLAILVDAITQAKPAGVIVSYMLHTQGQEDERYIVDLKLQSALAELEELRKPISLLGKTS